LEVSIAGRRHHAARPRAYQVAGGRVIDLSAHYALDEGGRVRVLFDRVDPQLPITFVPFSPQAGVR
jgi:xanthine/CO dehydrogenase XdhC/CoxF family maturation factor